MEQLTDEIITCKYEELKKYLPKITLNKKIGLVVLLNGIKYEFLLNIKSSSNDLICLGPSGLQSLDEINKFRDRPMFSRHSWEFEESILLYNDNTRYAWDDDLGAGWGVGLPDDFFLENIKQIIVRIVRFFNIKNRNILFYGSSMGGFTSIQLATMIKDSYAIAENTQIDATKWMEHVYVKNGLPAKLYEEETLKKFNPYTYNTLELMKKENYVPNLTIITDRYHMDIKEHLSMILNELDKLPFKSNDYHKINIIIEPSLVHEPIPVHKFYEIMKIYRSIKRKYYETINYEDINKSIPIIRELGLIDEEYYASNYKYVGELDSLTHYMIKGWKDGNNPSEEFNTTFYLTINEDVRDLGLNPLVHYALYGRHENRSKNEKEEIRKIQELIPYVKNNTLFDEEYYKKQCINLEKLSPIEHYLIYGWRNSLNPSDKFDNDFYIEYHPKLRKIQLNPLIHYMKYGKNENALIKPKTKKIN